MKNSMCIFRRLSAMLLAFAMVTVTLPSIGLSAYAETYSGICGDNATWELNTATGTFTISGFGDMYDYRFIEIYESPDVYVDAYLNSPWADYTNNITHAIIEDGITSIGDHTFFNFPDLISVSIPDSVIDIGEWAFSYCTSIEEITIPENTVRIGGYSFYGCTNLKKINIPDGISAIGHGLFSRCSSLTEMPISDTVTSINHAAFSNCSGLTEISIPDTVTSIDHSAFENCSNLISVDIPDSVETIGGSAFANCSSLKSIDIPDSVTAIEDRTFYGCTSLADISLPEGLAYIRYRAFTNTAFYNDESNWEHGFLYIGNNLIEVKSDVSGDRFVKDGTKVIAERAFYNCGSLESITVPSGAELYSGENLFEKCMSLKSIIVTGGDGPYISENGVLYNRDKSVLIRCPSGKTGDINIPGGVKSIGDYAFYQCENITGISLPDGVTTIGNCAFTGCKKITEIYLPRGVTSIGYSAFCQCDNLRKTNIPDGVTRIAGDVFSYCRNLESINIPNGVTYIGEYAFFECDKLKSITIPGSVSFIDEVAFGNCDSLTDVYYIGTYEDWRSIRNYSYYDFYDELWNKNIHFMPIVTHAAAQLSADGNSVRFIAAVEGLDYADIGFEVTVTDSEHGTNTVTIIDNAVYDVLTFDDVTLTSEDFNIEEGCLFVLMVENIPSDFNVSVRSFAIGYNGSVNYSLMRSYVKTGETIVKQQAKQ